MYVIVQITLCHFNFRMPINDFFVFNKIYTYNCMYKLWTENEKD